MLGGHGSCPDIFKYMPEAPDIPYGQIFYMVQFGCHLHTFFDHIIFKFREPKFWEMFLHHGVAVFFLIFFSYMSNEIAVGILVLFVHDPGDIFLDAVRFYNDLKIRNDIGVFILYVSFMGVWCYFRLYCFPIIVGEVMKTVFRQGASGQAPFLHPAYNYLIAMLCALVVLHVYWFAFIVRIALNIALKKKEYNTYDNKKMEKKEG